MTDDNDEKTQVTNEMIDEMGDDIRISLADNPLTTARPAYVAGLERRVEELTAALGRAIAVIEKMEYVDGPYSSIECPVCHSTGWNSIKHKEDCELEAALAEGRRAMGE